MKTSFGYSASDTRGYARCAFELDGGAANGTTVNLTLAAHVQRIGWQSAAAKDAEAGTTGKGLRMEALEIQIVKAS